MQQFLLGKLIFILLCASLDASEKQIHFQQSAHQTIKLDSPIDESALTPNMQKDNREEKKYFHRKAILINQGTSILNNLYPIVNGKDFRNIEKIFESLNIKKEEDQFYTFFNWWKNAIGSVNQSPNESIEAENVLRFLGCADSMRNAECLAEIASHFNISSRIVPNAGYFEREFYIQDGWRILDGCRNLHYLGLDNHTVVGFDEIVDDPFLVLRTKTSPDEKEWNALKSIENFALYEAFESEPYPEESFSIPEPSQFPATFDLFPKEKITYHYDLTPTYSHLPDSLQNATILRVIEQTIELSQRVDENHSSFVFKSPYPIYSISNHSSGDVYFTGENKRIKAEETIEIDQFPIFEIELIPEILKGHLSLLSLGNPLTFPTLIKDLNTLDLGEQAEDVILRYLFDDEIEQRSLPKISIENINPIFDHITPQFEFNAFSSQKMQWQIASDSEFKTILSNLEGIQDFEKTLTLDKIAETFINPNQTYYLRIRGFENGLWGNWSDLFSFKVLKPQRLENVNFEKLEENSYLLKWEKSTDSNAKYYIFASNSIDFLPSIYFEKEVDEISDGAMSSCKENDNCVAITTETQFVVNNQYPFYRIIVESNGAYSIPSPLIRVYDNGLSIPRDVLQVHSIGVDILGNPKFSAERIPFPKAYSYLEKPHLFSLLTREFRQNSSAIELFWAKTPPIAQRIYENPYVPSETWNNLIPYFLPENHPIKAQLDRIFTADRVTLNERNLKKAKFKNTTPGKFSHTIVTTHKQLKGYFIKLFTDYQHYDEVRHLMKRIHGVNHIKQALIKHSYQSICKVPDKWLYPLPPEPSPPPGVPRKNFILIAEDMDIYDKIKNYACWRGKEMTKEKVKMLFIIIKEEGLSDSVFAFNVPFAKDGKLTFIDTEHYHHWPVHFEKLCRYLSPAMQQYLTELMHH